MNPADLKIGVVLPMWTGSLNGETASMRRVARLCPARGGGGFAQRMGDRPSVFRSL